MRGKLTDAIDALVLDRGLTLKVAERPATTTEVESNLKDFTVMTMKQSDEWGLEYLNDGSGQWVAYCPDCLANNAGGQE
jgi:hypothetical protein